jgi:lipid-A-disaccharide synthase
VRIFLSAGEPSGVAIGATLMRTLRRRLPGVRFSGLGGGAMLEEGLRQIYDPARTAAMWLWGNLKRIPAHRRALRASIEAWERERPDLVVTIDYQAFHLFLGTAARERGIPVLHFVGSQFWGRRFYTLEPIRRAYDHVLLIHEFEKPLYDAAGIPATFVGHPLFERLQARPPDDAMLARLAALPRPRLGLLPGSRAGEITASLPVMLDAARRLAPRPHLLVSAGRSESRAYVDRAVARSGLPATVLDLASESILRASDLALITSGSATMEAVYYGCPAVVLYRLDFFNYFFARPHIVGFIAQPNLVAGRRVVPEFLLGSRNARGVAAAAQELLSDAPAREAQLQAFARIKARLLEGPPPSERAADVVEELLRGRS